MLKLKAHNINMHYEQQGSGESLILIPTFRLLMPAMPFRLRSMLGKPRTTRAL